MVVQSRRRFNAITLMVEVLRVFMIVAIQAKEFPVTAIFWVIGVIMVDVMHG
jgi:hypothetical protein